MPSRPGTRRRLIALLLLVSVLGLWYPARAHVRAASVLARFATAEPNGLIASAVRRPVDVRDHALEGTRARLYTPQGVDRPPGIVVVHGVHWKGIDEPRLQRFARSVAASGVAVMTPEIRELCDYRIDPASIDTIGLSARAFAKELGGRPVGVIGLSFAGGLSLIAASDPRYRDSFGFVVAVGAHDDLGRVLRFFVTNEAARADGTTLRMHAHDYGTTVLEYAHVEDFFPAVDVDVARETLRLLLHEDTDGAKERAKGLSTESAARMRAIFDHDVASVAPELLAEIERLRPGFAAVSPSAHVTDLRVPTFILHGAGDSLIPASEASWLAHDLPATTLRAFLVSPAIEHVEIEGKTTIGDELALVHFMSAILDAADERR